MALRKPVGLWHIFGLVVRDGFLGVLLGLGVHQSRWLALGGSQIGLVPNPSRKANLTIDYAVIS